MRSHSGKDLAMTLRAVAAMFVLTVIGTSMVSARAERQKASVVFKHWNYLHLPTPEPTGCLIKAAGPCHQILHAARSKQ